MEYRFADLPVYLHFLYATYAGAAGARKYYEEYNGVYYVAESETGPMMNNYK